MFKKKFLINSFFYFCKVNKFLIIPRPKIISKLGVTRGPSQFEFGLTLYLQTSNNIMSMKLEKIITTIK